jgi:hypothetical protein
VVVNTAQTVSATVQNLGTQAETFAVSLGDLLASSIPNTPQNVNLGAGASQIVTFTWTPTVSGTHNLTATAATVNGETNTANNSSQTTSTVNPVSGGQPTITSISPTTLKTGETNTSFTIMGTNFVVGATVSFQSGTGPAPTASAVTVSASGTIITATVTVPTGGPPRNRVWDLKVTNPNGQSAVLSQAFTVTP